MKALKRVLLIGLFLMPLMSFADYALDVQLPQDFLTDYQSITQYGLITGDLVGDTRLETVVPAQGNIYFDPDDPLAINLAKILVVGLDGNDQPFTHELDLDLSVLCPDYDDDVHLYNQQIETLLLNTPPVIADIDGDGKNEIVVYLSKRVRFNDPDEPSPNQYCPYYRDGIQETTPHQHNCDHYYGVLAAFHYNLAGAPVLYSVSAFMTTYSPRVGNAIPVAFDFDQDGDSEIALCGYSSSVIITGGIPSTQPVFFEVFNYDLGDLVLQGNHTLSHPRGYSFYDSDQSEYPVSVAIGNMIQTSPDIDVAISSYDMVSTFTMTFNGAYFSGSNTNSLNLQALGYRSFGTDMPVYFDQTPPEGYYVLKLAHNTTTGVAKIVRMRADNIGGTPVFSPDIPSGMNFSNSWRTGMSIGNRQGGDFFVSTQISEVISQGGFTYNLHQVTLDPVAMSRTLISYNNIGQQRARSRKAPMILDYDNNGTADIVYGISAAQGYELYKLSGGAGTPTSISTISNYYNTEYGDYLFSKDMDGDGDLEFGIVQGGTAGYGFLRIQESLTTQVNYNPHTDGSSEFRGESSHNSSYEKEYSGSSTTAFYASNGTGGKQAYWSERILISDDFTLSSSDDLYVKAGTIVRIASGATLTIHGDLEVLGTESDPVYFICDDASSSWSGLVLSKNATFNHCVFDDLDGETVATVTASAQDIEFYSCTFKNFDIGIQPTVTSINRPSPAIRIDDCEFTGGSYSISGSLLGADIYATNSVFQGADYYAVEIIGGKLTFEGCSFGKNDRGAIYASSADVYLIQDTNYIESNGDILSYPVVFVTDTNLRLRNCIVQKNDCKGIYMEGVSYGDFSNGDAQGPALNRIANNYLGREIFFDKYCDIYLWHGGNDIYDETDPLLIEYGSSIGSFDVRYNYWGGTPSSANFSPSALFDWSMYSTTPYTQTATYDPLVRSRMEEVKLQRQTGQYQNAWDICVAILDSFSVSDLAPLALREMMSLKTELEIGASQVSSVFESYATPDHPEHLRFQAKRLQAMLDGEAGDYENGHTRLNQLLEAETDTTRILLLLHDDAKLSYLESMVDGGSGIASTSSAHGTFHRALARLTGVELGDDEHQVTGQLLPTEFSMRAFPNPFNAQTRVTISLPKSSTIQGRVFSILGREIASFQKSAAVAGVHEFHMDASTWASGLYVVSVDAGEYHAVNKIVLVK